MEDVAANLSTIRIEVFTTQEAYPQKMKHTYEWPNQTAYRIMIERKREESKER